MYDMGEKEIEAVRKVIEGKQLFRYAEGATAKFTAKLEKALAEKMGTKFALATSSGTGALISALAGVGVGPGDEVLVPGYTFIATALAPLAVGAVPIITDVDRTLTLDPEDVSRKINRHTKAIIPVHMAGLPCNMQKIMRLARKHKLAVVEDAAQAAGGSYGGKRLGATAEVGILSFNHYKIISSGEGGAVVTDSPEIHRRAMVYHDGGCVFFDDNARNDPGAFFAGLNFRISEIQSAIMNVQLARLDGILKKLRARKKAMLEIFASADGFEPCPSNDIKGDCGTTIPLWFASAELADRFARQYEKRVGLFRPIETDRHVYSNWDPILNQAVHHPHHNPWHWAKRTIKQMPDCCPATTEILSRTVCIQTPFGATVAEARKLARHMKEF
ncbi:MAG: DegT/DnrJ/EryC1/StrS family aminotransferase [Phycisphaerae bacterium]